MPSNTIGDHIGLRRARNQTVRNLDDDSPLTHVVLPISQPNCFCNSAVSSFFLLPTISNETTKKKQYSFPQTTSFRGMGCTAAAAAQQVSVPSVIRSSADWDARIRRDKKKHIKKKMNKRGSYNDGSTLFLNEARDVDGPCCIGKPDVWCGSGQGFSTDAVVGQFVDPPVVSGPPRRSLPSSHRKIDVDTTNYNQAEVNLSSSVLPRRVLNQESHSHAFFISDSMSTTSSRAEPTFLTSRYNGHLRRPYPHDLTEILLLRNGFVMGRTTDQPDHFHDLRLDVDSMSYEQLLELGDRIGYVNTGLKESETHRCIQKINASGSHALADRKCSICQDEYEREEQVGKLDCGHTFHVQCVKQWLSRKNACPVCKKTAYIKP